MYKSYFGNELGRDETNLYFFGVPLFSEPRGFGQDWYVDSVTGGSGRSGKNPKNALATIAQAFAKCRANKGDRIICLPGHAENVSASTALAVAGVTVIGLGFGRNRPTVTFDTANTSTYAIGADNIRFYNVRFLANFLSIAAPFTLGAAKAFRLQECTFMDTSSILNFLNIVKSTGVANTVDSLHLENNRWDGLGTTSVNSFALTANDIDNMTLRGNRIRLSRTATAAILLTVTAGVLTDALIEDNTCVSQQTADTGGSLVNVGGTTSTGIVKDNNVGDLATTDLLVTTSVGLSYFNNKKTGVITASAYLLPATDS